MSCVLCRYYQWTFNCATGGLLVRIYLIGIVAMHCVIILLVMVLVNRSAQGAIYDTQARRVVPHLLVVKYVSRVRYFRNRKPLNRPEQITMYATEGLLNTKERSTLEKYFS